MSEFEELEGLSDSAKQYILLNYEIIKLEATKKTSEIGSSVFSILILGITFSLFAFALSLGLGFYLSALLGDSFSGFGIIAGLYLLISIILLIGRKKLMVKPFRDMIIKNLLDNNRA